MSVLDVYDHLLGDFSGQIERQRDEIANRNALLRHQLAQRVAGELGLEVHSVAPSALTSWLGQAIRLYLAGFYDASIREAVTRLASACQGRLLSLMLWEPGSVRAGKAFAALRGSFAEVCARRQPALVAPASPSGIATAFRDQGCDMFDGIPAEALLAAADAAGFFAGTWRDRVLASLGELNAKDRSLIDRDRDQGRQVAVAAVEAGASSGGPGAVHTEAVLGFYLKWGANLHLLLADAVVASCLLLRSERVAAHAH